MLNKDGKILIIAGPTCSGKSVLARRAALELNGRVINADSMQLYNNLPILSAQPNKNDLSEVGHSLYSIFSHENEVSVAIWLKLVKKEIDECFSLGLLPVVTGGTGLYLSRLICGISIIPDIGPEIRGYSR